MRLIAGCLVMVLIATVGLTGCVTIQENPPPCPTMPATQPMKNAPSKTHSNAGSHPH